MPLHNCMAGQAEQQAEMPVSLKQLHLNHAPIPSKVEN